MILRVALAASLVSALLAAKEPLQPVEVKTVRAVAYSKGMAVRIAETAGQLNIEAWDQPRVEATLSTVEWAGAHEQVRVKKRLQRIGLVVEKESGDVTVEMQAPSRHFWARLLRGKTNATVTCTVMIPRDAQLIVRHQDGAVVVYGAGGDIDASTRFGDIVLQLATPGKYSMDARVRIGGVYTDYDGKYRQPLLVGQKFITDGGAGAHKVTARVGVGGISIVSTAPPLSVSAPAPLH